MSQDQVRTFAHTIAAINHGALDDELSDALFLVGLVTASIAIASHALVSPLGPPDGDD